MSDEFSAFSDVVAERAEAVRTLCLAMDEARSPQARRIMARMAEQVIQTICIDPPVEKTMAEKIREIRK